MHQRLHYGGINCPFFDKLFQRKEQMKVYFVNCREAIRGDLQNIKNETGIIIKVEEPEKEIIIKVEKPEK